MKVIDTVFKYIVSYSRCFLLLGIVLGSYQPMYSYQFNNESDEPVDIYVFNDEFDKFHSMLITFVTTFVADRALDVASPNKTMIALYLEGWAQRILKTITFASMAAQDLKKESTELVRARMKESNLSKDFSKFMDVAFDNILPTSAITAFLGDALFFKSKYGVEYPIAGFANQKKYVVSRGFPYYLWSPSSEIPNSILGSSIFWLAFHADYIPAKIEKSKVFFNYGEGSAGGGILPGNQGKGAVWGRGDISYDYLKVAVIGHYTGNFYGYGRIHKSASVTILPDQTMIVDNDIRDLPTDSTPCDQRYRICASKNSYDSCRYYTFDADFNSNKAEDFLIYKIKEQSITISEPKAGKTVGEPCVFSVTNRETDQDRENKIKAEQALLGEYQKSNQDELAAVNTASAATLSSTRREDIVSRDAVFDLTFNEKGEPIITGEVPPFFLMPKEDLPKRCLRFFNSSTIKHLEDDIKGGREAIVVLDNVLRNADLSGSLLQQNIALDVCIGITTCISTSSTNREYKTCLDRLELYNPKDISNKKICSFGDCLSKEKRTMVDTLSKTSLEYTGSENPLLSIDLLLREFSKTSDAKLLMTTYKPMVTADKPDVLKNFVDVIRENFNYRNIHGANKVVDKQDATIATSTSAQVTDVSNQGLFYEKAPYRQCSMLDPDDLNYVTVCNNSSVTAMFRLETVIKGDILKMKDNLLKSPLTYVAQPDSIFYAIVPPVSCKSLCTNIKNVTPIAASWIFLNSNPLNNANAFMKMKVCRWTFDWPSISDPVMYIKLLGGQYTKQYADDNGLSQVNQPRSIKEDKAFSRLLIDANETAVCWFRDGIAESRGCGGLDAQCLSTGRPVEGDTACHGTEWSNTNDGTNKSNNTGETGWVDWDTLFNIPAGQ